MPAANQNKQVIAQGAGILHSHRAGDRNIAVPRDRPGVVIFLHGVNDPGASYSLVEQGLCAGVGERLGRTDLKPGQYGVAFAQAKDVKHGQPGFDLLKSIKYDPDTYLYQRTEVATGVDATNSILIPFYWGYRAAPNEIKGGEKNPATLRGQYQDKAGNRLSKHFAKGGGMFNNATTNIPAMYDAGWSGNAANWLAVHTQMSDYQYSNDSPHRHYFVLAAERLAMLVREIRAVDPNETITIMAHSQGTLITLLAQALLVEDGTSRCADCIIMVDTPYGLGEPTLSGLAQPRATPYTTRGKLNTLINIVKAVSAQPHRAPALTELGATNPDYGGRTGLKWSPEPKKAVRLDKDGSTHVFSERDNRGKVYLYFCTEDHTVNIPTIQGIGTHGVPDSIDEEWVGSRKVLGVALKSKTTLPAMDMLKKIGFRQRLWSKVPEERADGKHQPRTVGKAPEYYDTVIAEERRCVNGEEIVPPYVPNLYGQEAIKGTPTKDGLDRPDHVSRDLLIGNSNAALPFKAFPTSCPKNIVGNLAAMKAWYNAQYPDPEDQTGLVRSMVGLNDVRYEREETPNEARERLEKDHKKWDGNSYHSAILRDADNMRRVASMDVAIGQARSLDDQDMRNLLTAIADWKITRREMDAIQKNPRYNNLSGTSRALVEASYFYYSQGKFPNELISKKPPKLVDSETFRDREKRQ
ncbi:T6SS effector phospholipase Tle3 domain-containing protein [Ralstonia solanacearum]|uniref:T6SS effector phospholipase Tle3 domain-containing protein n=1 Tax=Ralstonia solanacearum TaxID=305 RepID=UPI001865D070|nr:DUF3274 domain-containing protein [Ralstonia solanacearum]QOK84477.1 DUF3274 domain-containing protein [Ralstonia solanacearum]